MLKTYQETSANCRGKKLKFGPFIYKRGGKRIHTPIACILVENFCKNVKVNSVYL